MCFYCNSGGCVILHITRQRDWEAAQVAGGYRGDTLDTEGFIHCSAPNQVCATAELFFAGHTDLVLLCIDPSQLQSDVRYEVASNGQTYPHIYGFLNLDAVTKVVAFPPGADGHFELPLDLR